MAASGATLGISVSADAKQAAATFKDLAADIKNVGKESVGVTDGVARVAAALDKLKSAPDTPVALARATAKAKVEIADLRAELEKTPGSAEKMKAITAALKQADQAIEASIKRAGKLGEAQEEVKQKMGLTAKGAEALGGSLGSLTGVMGKMADSSSAVAQGVAKVGFSVVAAGQAFELGYSSGEKFRKGLEAIGVQLPDLSDKTAALVVGVERLARGYESAELVESAAMNRARQIIALREAQAASELSLARAMASAGVEWKSADAEREKVIQKLNAVEQILSRAGKSEEEYGKVIKANAPLLMELAKASSEHEIALGKVAPRTAEAAAAAAEYAATQKGMAGAVSDATGKVNAQTEAMKRAAAAAKAASRTGEKTTQETDYGKQKREAAEFAEAMRGVNEQYDANVAKQQEWIAESTRVETQMNKWIDSTQGAGKAFGSLSGDFSAINAEVKSFIEAGGNVNDINTSMTTIALSVAQASDQATAALYRQLEATKLLREEQLAALDVGKGWRDYLANLKEGYDVGLTSLSGYINGLIAFKTNLAQMFGTATGEAKKAIEDLMQSIEALIATAGSRGQYDASYTGELNRAFNGGA